jgi:hypothetical protein
LDVVEVFADGSQRALRASDPSLPGIEVFSRQLGVGLRPDFSKTENRRYLMHHCRHCNAKLGDHFLYVESSRQTLIAGTEVWHATLCEAGHWECAQREAVPDHPPQRTAGSPSMTSGHATHGGVGVEVGITLEDAIGRMIGRW